MAQIVIKGGIIATPSEVLTDASILIDGHKIGAILPNSAPLPTAAQIIAADGMWVTPGFIDIHVHGGVEADVMDATPEALHQIANFKAKHGVTSYFPTTMSGTETAVYQAIQTIKSCPQSPNGAHHLGVHVEGPYLNTDYKGAQPDHFLRDADPREYRKWLASNVVKLVTVAPERPGVMEFIAEGVKQGVEFAVAHSGASYEQVLAAVGLGLRQGTHTFNGMLGLHHRRPGTAGAILTDARMYAQIIADGIHVHPAMVKLLVQAKGVEHTILITDAMRAAGCDDGNYDLGGEQITVADGVARTDSGSLAGSTLTMDAAIRNVMAFTNLSFTQVLPMATVVPAAAMNLTGQKGVLSPGADADIVLLDQTHNVQLTMVAGQVVFQGNYE